MWLDKSGRSVLHADPHGIQTWRVRRLPGLRNQNRNPISWPVSSPRDGELKGLNFVDERCT